MRLVVGRCGRWLARAFFFRRGHPQAAALWAACAVLSAGMLAAISVTPAAHATTQQQATASVKILLDSISPSAARADQPLTITGRVVASPSSQRQQLSVTVRSRTTALPAREGIAALSTSSPTDLTALPLDPNASRIPLAMPAEGSARFTLVVPAGGLGYRQFGVYPLQLSLTLGPLTASLTTAVVWQPTTLAAQPTRLGWLWPVMDEPARSAVDTFSGSTLRPRPDPQQSTALAASLDNDSRLGRIVQAWRRANNPQGATMVVDPALLQNLTTLIYPNGFDAASRPPASPSDQPSPDAAEGTSPSPAQQAATWLRTLDELAPPDSRVVVPYADVDSAALVHADYAEVLSYAVQRSVTIAAQGALPDASSAAQPASTAHGWVAWPSDGQLPTAAVNALREADPGNSSAPLQGLVLADTALTPEQPSSATLDARGQLSLPSGSVPVLRTDSILSELADTTPDNDDPNSTTAMLRQLFLAHTAMITAERPSDARTVIVAPAHRWSPDPTLAGQLLAISKEVPWLQPITAQQAWQQPSTTTWKKLSYPKSSLQHELPPAYLEQLGEQITSSDDFASLLSVAEPTTTRLRDAQLRLASTALRSENHEAATRRTQALDDFTQTLDSWRSQVSIKASSATLGAREGPIPITVVNNLDQPVRLRLRIDPSLPRITVTKQAPLITAAAGRRTQVNVPVQAVANGPVDLLAQLRTPSGHNYGEPAIVTVRVQTLGPLGLLLTLGTGTLFVVAVFTRTARRRLRSRRLGVSQ